MTDGWIDRLAAAAGVSPLRNEPLSRFTSYRTGGAAEALVAGPAGTAARAFSFARGQGVPVTLLGAGTNVIAPDEGLDGLTIVLRGGDEEIVFDGGTVVRAGAGVPLETLARAAAARGLAGLEELAGIPGTVGGAVVMNAGARERETADLLRRVEVMTRPDGRRTFDRDELSYGYRKSVFRHAGWLVLSAEFELERGDPAATTRRIDALRAERRAKYPCDEPSAGSVFKRPPGDYAGRLVEAAGCKGLRVGGALVSPRHANFIVTTEGAASADILEVIGRVRARVWETGGVWLELEQIPLGERK
ncbi:MAG: UDP-N-acetylmuramate dehydrogenase [Candidatus Krumholzibacteriota bacterium]|nr:UDP-N-acetylmuramate dehydrogenase [Candidatus Krumholzibacteriota bacterium]